MDTDALQSFLTNLDALEIEKSRNPISEKSINSSLFVQQGKSLQLGFNLGDQRFEHGSGILDLQPKNRTVARTFNETLRVLNKLYKDYVYAFISLKNLTTNPDQRKSHLFSLDRDFDSPADLQFALNDIVAKENAIFENNLNLPALKKINSLYRENREKPFTYVWTFQRYFPDTAEFNLKDTNQLIYSMKQTERSDQNKLPFVSENQRINRFEEAQRIDDFFFELENGKIKNNDDFEIINRGQNRPESGNK
jgi:hypothetical protein